MKMTKYTFMLSSNYSATTALLQTAEGWKVNYPRLWANVSFSQPPFVIESIITKLKITYAMKTILLILLFACNLFSSQAQSEITKDNFVVILDLSDRLVAEDQAETDIAMISAMANKFVKTATSKILFKSEDAFRVVIIPQQGSPLDAQKFQSLLHLDLGQTAMALRAKKLKEWEKQLPQTLAQLYKEARYSTTHADYYGVDIWQYFNEHLVDDLKSTANNQLLVITDGYFDFESYTRQQQIGNRYTNTRFLRDLAGQAWQAEADKKDFGLLPTASLKAYNLQVIVGSIRPKKDDLSERAKLEYVWNKWLKEIGISKSRLINHTYKEKMLGILAEAY